MPAQAEEKSMVPTVLVGIGGTGTEVLARVRRLIEETYVSLNNFPIVSFLIIDTDKDYKINNTEAGGSPFKDNEKHWARVSGKQVREMVADMENYPWIDSWFPRELERNITSLEAGAGQIRACGRFAFFCNYYEIQKKFLEAVNRTKGRDNFMLDRYGIKVNSGSINVFVTGSLSGGTGSGMLIDIGYCVRNWVKKEQSPLVTAIVPTPEAFAGINVGDKVLANGYAAMMELSYFSDHRTEYVSQFSNGLADEVRSKLPPFDFTYLVGTKNGETDFKLEQIREMIAQNIFLDLTSDFSPHKRSIRDNIKSAWSQADPGGRGYPKNFMSFGLSTIEIPIAQIRTSLSNRLAQDLVSWWLNETAILPAQMRELVQNDILKRMRLTEAEMITDISAAQDRSFLAIISDWINSIRQEIASENLLQCTQQGVNMLGREKGKILQFVDGYLKPKVDQYRSDHFRELSPDERLHGDYFGKMYDNRNQLVVRGRQTLESEFYRILEDRTQGPKFAAAFIVTVRQILEDTAEKFRSQRDRIWEPKENERQKQYEQGLQDLTEFKDKFGTTKQAKMEQYCEKALSGLEGALIAIIQRKARSIGLDLINRLQEHLTALEYRFNRLQQKLIQTRDLYKEKADKQAKSADALIINGIKLYDRQELNSLYEDLIAQLAGATVGNKTAYETGMDSICSTMSQDVLNQASPLWKETRAANEVMRLFDITEIPDVKDEDLQQIIFYRTKQVLENAPQTSKIKQELAACDRIFKVYNDNSEIVNNIRIAYNKSKPLILLNQAVLRGKDANFTPALNVNVAVLGGRKTSDPAAQKFVPMLQEFIGNEDAIKPLGDPERHRVIFVQEIGGFSLRCIDGMRDLRQSYQDWKGEFIVAKRAQLKGESRDLPVPVHIQKEPPFWDIFPEDPRVFHLVVQARALAILRQEENKATKENSIRYTKSTAIGEQKVDIASSWEEVTQVLEIKACREDREEIQRQVLEKLNAADTDAKKQALFRQLLGYLEQRALELSGGKDSPDYKREAQIILNLIEAKKLKTSTEISVTPEQVKSSVAVSQPVNQVAVPTKLDGNNGATTQQDPAPLTSVFCTNCGTKNPASSKFCFKCGTKLVK
ncbi:MAG: tubulin-like doman-containing protein [Oscillatoria sp. PMC 1068.18]|nr:tubulin-like doman-containing protein [Oscillatoria sp. PMC 1076.18]MEC4987143.1 tubulin-like doman-containing protein [Oscillatoria sp. PMC 1068.18]